MKRNESYLYKEIAGTSYLLPYGQMIADLKPGIQINETGVFIWIFLEQEHSFEEILTACAEYYEIPETDLQGIATSDYLSLREDLSQFIKSLHSMGILLEDSDQNADTVAPLGGVCDTEDISHNTANALPFTENASPSTPEVITNHLLIGGLHLKLTGPKECFSDSFQKFRTDDSPYTEQNTTSADQIIRIIPGQPPACENSRTILHNRELSVLHTPEYYILLFPMAKQIHRAILSKDGQQADFYITLPTGDTLREDLFHAIRLAYLYLAQKKNMTAIHSASILYRGKAWLFSAPSGTGKSTHTNLWRKLYETETRNINGDLNLLGFENGKPVVYGIPWCGTSGICDIETHPLGGIVLLKQAKNNVVSELRDDQKILSVLHRFISPSWTAELFEANLSFVEKLVPEITVCKLFCNMEDDAAHTMKKYIDTEHFDTKLS